MNRLKRKQEAKPGRAPPPAPRTSCCCARSATCSPRGRRRGRSGLPIAAGHGDHGVAPGGLAGRTASVLERPAPRVRRSCCRPAPRSPRRAGKRHRRSVQLRPRARRADPALGRRGRPADAGFICRCGRAVAGRRRDLLHPPARHSGAARGARPLSPAHLRPAVRARALLRHRRRHAGDPDRHAAWSPAPATRCSFRTPAWPNLTAAIGITGATPVPVPMTLGNAGWTLDLDRLFASVTRAHHGDLPQLADQPDRLDGDAATISAPSSPSLASAACGSSPTRSITASSMPASARPPSTTSPSRTSASSTSTPSPRTGR